jgi:hypothetical protein
MPSNEKLSLFEIHSFRTQRWFTVKGWTQYGVGLWPLLKGERSPFQVLIHESLESGTVRAPRFHPNSFLSRFRHWQHSVTNVEKISFFLFFDPNLWPFLISLSLPPSYSSSPRTKVNNAFLSVIRNFRIKLERLCLASFSSLVEGLDVRTEPIWMKHLSGTLHLGGLLALPTDIRSGWKGFTGTNSCLKWERPIRKLK